jgi:Mg/Co/Ni transporter MgtE
VKRSIFVFFAALILSSLPMAAQAPKLSPALASAAAGKSAQ